MRPSASIANKFRNLSFPMGHSDWNLLVDRYRRNRPLRLVNNTVGKWKHPWQITGGFDPAISQFRFSVRPGFVNAGEVETPRIPVDLLPESTIERTGAETGREAGWITEGVRIPIAADFMRKIGPDADATGYPEEGVGEITFEPVPRFFQRRGVGDPPSAQITPGGVIETDGATRSRGEERRLRAVEVTLKQQRITSTVELGQGKGGDEGFVTFDVKYGDPPRRSLPYIEVTPSYSPPADPLSAADLRYGQFTDDGVDQLHLATIYLLSDPGRSEEGDPDGKWRMYVHQRVHWNVNYATNLLPVIENDAGVSTRFATTLAAGSATDLLGNFAGDINDAIREMENLLRDNRIQGRFWSI